MTKDSAEDQCMAEPWGAGLAHGALRPPGDATLDRIARTPDKCARLITRTPLVRVISRSIR